MNARSCIGKQSGVDWVSLYDDVDECASRFPEAPGLISWIEDYLIRPHQSLGRTGAVCPFVKQAVKGHTIWTAFVSGDTDPTVEAMQDMVDDAMDIYIDLIDTDNNTPLHTVVTIFPDLTDCRLIEAVQSARKSQFVQRGLMLGEFYPGCQQTGLWNKDFFPLDSPMPMLVVRKMMKSDFPFLASSPEWLYAYLSQYAPDLPARLRRAIAERLHVHGDLTEAIAELRIHEINQRLD
ncbi:hypothetical protein GV794_21825 [Nocardia cyriacigeorgica]|uniref:DUF6875 domain-containing protein n=1 Tax=Nocardia cyriacigeorgica TaxID=135487 RepID=A0ABX0CST6_9NOCA|nr:hypothetical protein [Nocardia cyriacigeorgica]